MMLGLPAARYIVMPHYVDKVKQLLQLTNDMEGGMPLQYDVVPLGVSTQVEPVGQSLHSRALNVLFG